jgi:hypothetical protein
MYGTLKNIPIKYLSPVEGLKVNFFSHVVIPAKEGKGGNAFGTSRSHSEIRRRNGALTS